MTRPILVFLAAVLAMPALVPAQTPAPAPVAVAATGRLPIDPAVTIGTLPNGMRYYVRRNTRPEKRVLVQLAVKTGSVFEDDDQRGLAHLLEHMAFNGTAHFKPGELVSFFETAGSRFGPHVNAYTSFDETVYMLQVPTDKEGLVDKGLLALADFAGGMSLDPKEIDKERGVVIEEWRLRQGASWRILEKQAPVLYYKSRYAQRIPIGTPEILRSFPAARLKDFYETWYRPDRMAVVVVGDIDPAAIVPKLRELFAPLETPARRRRRARSLRAGPRRDVRQRRRRRRGPSLQRVGAAQAAETAARLGRRLPARPRAAVDVSDAQPALQRDHAAAGRAVSRRRRRLAGAGGQHVGHLAWRTHHRWRSAKGLEALLARGSACARVRLHRRRARPRQALGAGQLRAGVRRAREDREPGLRARVRRQLPRRRADSRHRTRVRAHQGAAAGHHARGGQRRGPRTARRQQPRRPGHLAREGRCHAAVGSRAARRVGEGGDGTLTPWTETLSRTELLTRKPTPGKVSSSRTIDAIGTTVLTLSNGAEVWLKPTDFKNDQVLLGAVARGGASAAPEAEYLETVLAASFVSLAGVGGLKPPEIGKILSGRLVSVGAFIDLSTQGIRGSSRPQDLETALQMLYLTFTEPNADSQAMDLLKRQLSALVANRSQNPQAVFGDRLRALNTGNSYLVRPFTTAAVGALGKT